MEKLNELKEAFYPQYGMPGSRDMDVTARRKVIDENIEAVAEAFRALEKEAQKNLEGALAWLNRAEAAEAALERESDIHIDTAASMREWRLRAEAAEAKLATIESNHTAVVLGPPTYWRQAGGKFQYTIETSEPLKNGTELFNRPVPAADLADLLPPKKELVSDTKNLQACEWGFHLQDEGWNKCIDAMIKNIEARKND